MHLLYRAKLFVLECLQNNNFTEFLPNFTKKITTHVAQIINNLYWYLAVVLFMHMRILLIKIAFRSTHLMRLRANTVLSHFISSLFKPHSSPS